jgi:hypothetical protein
METNSQRDERLWLIAKSRARFKTHLMIYLVINGFLWAVWYLTDRDFSNGAPWPVWPALVWGVGLSINYFKAWHRDPFGDTLKEYDKLQEEKQRRGF